MLYVFIVQMMLRYQMIFLKESWIIMLKLQIKLLGITNLCNILKMILFT